MIESELPAPDVDEADVPDPGPPVLLKRLGNAVEANLAKNKLETAGIPSFLGGENTFAGDVMHPLPYREVELFVPQSMVTDALEVLDAPPTDPSELSGEPYVDDPGRALSFRAFVTAVIGWLLFTLALGGVLLSLPAFCYAITLSFRALHVSSTERSAATIAKSVLAMLLAAAGIVVAFVAVLVLSR